LNRVTQERVPADAFVVAQDNVLADYADVIINWPV